MKQFDAELIKKVKEAKSVPELMTLAKANGIKITAEEANTCFEKLHPQSGELSDDELDNVAGGCGDSSANVHNWRHCCEHFRCEVCGNSDPNCRFTSCCANCSHGSEVDEKNVKCYWIDTSPWQYFIC